MVLISCAATLALVARCADANPPARAAARERVEFSAPGGLLVSFGLHRRAQLGLLAADTTGAESCWVALTHRPSPWRWEAVRSLTDLALARRDSTRADSLLSKLPRSFPNPADRAEHSLYLARVRAARGDSAAARSACANVLLEPAADSALAAVALLDRLRPPRPGDATFARIQSLAAEVEVLHASRPAAIARLRELRVSAPGRPLSPLRSSPDFRLADLLRQSRRFAESMSLLDSLERIARSAEDVTDLLLTRARVLRDEGRTDSAFIAYRRTASRAALESRRLTVETANWELAREADENGRWSDAREAYARVDSLGLDRARAARLRLGLLWLIERQVPRAIACFSRDTTEAARFWWAMCARDSQRAQSDSVLLRIARQPGFRYYAVRSREALRGSHARDSLIAIAERAGPPGPADQALDRTRPRTGVESSDGEALRLARTLVGANLLPDAAFLIERWMSGDEEAGAPAEGGVDSWALLSAAELEETCDRFAPAIRLARRAFDASADSDSVARGEAIHHMYPLHYVSAIAAASRGPGLALEPELLTALVWQESRFDSGAVSHSGAIGLTQLMPRTAAFAARRLGEKLVPDSALVDPARNIRWGALELRRLLERFDGRVPLALAAYNAGIPAAERWAKRAQGTSEEMLCEMIAYPETQDYVKSILAARAAYRELRPRSAARRGR